MNRNPGKVVFFAADLSDSREVKTIVPAVLDAFGRLDFAFNNAGISGAEGPIVEQSEQEYDLVFGINVKAMFLLLQDELRQIGSAGFWRLDREYFVCGRNSRSPWRGTVCR